MKSVSRSNSQIELFEIGLRSLRGQTRLVAEQLFVDGKKQSEITGAEGKLLTRRTVVREKENWIATKLSRKSLSARLGS